MAVSKIVDGAWLVGLGSVNAVLLEHEGELTLVDAGFPGKEQLIFNAIQQVGHHLSDLKNMVFTHAHPDHIGSAAAVQRAAQVTTWIHDEDAQIAGRGGPFRPMTPSPELIKRALFGVFWKPNEEVEPVRIDHRVVDGDVLPVAGGLRAVHTPGHCAGQISLLWKGNRLLIVGDVASNVLRIGDPLGFEDRTVGVRSQEKIAQLDFEAAAFGHGTAIRSGAAERMRRKWPRRPTA